jgi:hypothetical protein
VLGSVGSAIGGLLGAGSAAYSASGGRVPVDLGVAGESILAGTEGGPAQVNSITGTAESGFLDWLGETTGVTEVKNVS